MCLKGLKNYRLSDFEDDHPGSRFKTVLPIFLMPLGIVPMPLGIGTLKYFFLTSALMPRSFLAEEPQGYTFSISLESTDLLLFLQC